MSLNALPPAAASFPLDSLLARLREGDPISPERLFHEYEPYLRFIVRKQFSPRLRAKFDSTDVLQSVWECLIRELQTGGRAFESPDHLRTFLVKVARLRFFDQIRQHQGALENESPSPSDGQSFPSPDPRPSEEVQAKDVWDQLLQLCPPAHHDILRLKRQGMSLADIGERTGLHPDSIRRILRNLARRYASKEL